MKDKVIFNMDSIERYKYFDWKGYIQHHCWTLCWNLIPEKEFDEMYEKSLQTEFFSLLDQTFACWIYRIKSVSKDLWPVEWDIERWYLNLLNCKIRIYSKDKEWNSIDEKYEMKKLFNKRITKNFVSKLKNINLKQIVEKNRVIKEGLISFSINQYTTFNIDFEKEEDIESLIKYLEFYINLNSKLIHKNIYWMEEYSCMQKVENFYNEKIIK